MASANHVAETVLTLQSQGLDRERALIASGFEGVALNAPPTVSPDSDGGIPMLLAAQLTGLRGFEHPRETSYALVAMDRARRTTRFGRLFRPPASTVMAKSFRQPSTRPEGSNAVGLLSRVSQHDVTSVIGGAWPPGAYRFAVIYFDWLSNVVDVTVESAAEVDTGTYTPPSPEPALPFPTYLPSASHVAPPQPGEPAVFNLAFDSGSRQVTAWGSFSAVVDACHVPPEPLRLGEHGGAMHEVGAVVPVTLAIMKAGRPTPIRHDWAVPAYGQASVGAVVQGYFAHHAGDGLEPGAYAAYLVVEGTIAGPVRFDVPEEARPRG